MNNLRTLSSFKFTYGHRWAWSVLSLAGVACSLALARASGGTAAAETNFHWFSAPIEISGLPGGETELPVACEIDFSALLAKLKVAGAVDPRSVRLRRILEDGSILEEPVQFTPAPQPRLPKRRLLPGTTKETSYLAEHAAGETPGDLRVMGHLAWMAVRVAQSMSPFDGGGEILNAARPSIQVGEPQRDREGSP